MNPIIRLAALAGMMLFSLSPAVSAVVRLNQNFSEGWHFNLGDAAGIENSDYTEGNGLMVVRLPHTWNTKDTFDDVPGYYRGIGWYRKSFTIPANWAGKRIAVRFEAACQVATVWVNNSLMGEHKGCFTPFQFDITNIAKPGGNNFIAVRVDNRWRRDIPPYDMDFNLMGGLQREASLIATSDAHIVSTRVTTPRVSVSGATARFEMEIQNESSAEKMVEAVTIVTSPEGANVVTLSSPVRLAPGAKATVRQETEVAKPQLWSPDTPRLYHVSFVLRESGTATDDDAAPLGFRWYRFDSQKGFFLNGQPLKLRGANRHDDYPGLGWALPSSRQVKDVELIKQIGCNFVRLAHYAQDPSVLEACDRLGLLVWEEVPFDGEGQQLAPYEGATGFAETLQQMLRDTIHRDRNHPSIILWSVGNENLNGATASEWTAVANLERRLAALAKTEDPTRPTAMAIDRLDRADEVGLFDAVDVVGCNIYRGWYGGVFDDFGKVIDEVHRKHPDRPLVISEYGADMGLGLHSEHPVNYDFSEEWGCLMHESYLRQIGEREFIAGSLLWNIFDFGVEERMQQSVPHLNQKGIYDYYRRPKDVYYLYQSQWTTQPMVNIVSHTWTERQGKPGEQKSIKVYSNCERVELFLNGKSLGTKSSSFVWPVVLQPGDNQLRAVGRKGSGQVTDSMTVRY